MVKLEAFSETGSWHQNMNQSHLIGMPGMEQVDTLVLSLERASEGVRRSVDSRLLGRNLEPPLAGSPKIAA